MMLSGHQPVYLPGIILFNKIFLSDKFMFVGHCQYSAKSWHSHNLIRNARLTVPVQHSFGESINDVQISGDHWKRKHLRSIELNYSKRPFFDLYFPKLEQYIELPWQTLGTMNIGLIALICDWLRLDTEIINGVQFNIRGHKTEMLIDMCRHVGADQYLSNEGSRAYVQEQQMADAGIKHRWQKFTHPIYDQGQKEFITNLSIIDLLFNCGPASGRIVKDSGYVG